MDKNRELKKLEEKSIEYIANKWKWIGLPQHRDKEAIKQEMNDENKMGGIVDDIEKRLFPVEGKRVLDVGCGIGGLAVACRLRGAVTIGFDDDIKALKICRFRAKCYRIQGNFFLGNAQHLPFPDDYFDILTATSVLEHVKNQEKSIKEMCRVGKNIYIIIPNPLHPIEAHYRIFWFPYLPKKLVHAYLKLRGFNPKFFDQHVYYMSIPYLTKLLEENGMIVKNITKQDILNKLEQPVFITDINLRKIAKIMKLMKIPKSILKITYLFPSTVTLIASKKEINSSDENRKDLARKTRFRYQR